MDNLLPVYQHPALTVLIDDSRSFLDSLEFRLNTRMACKSFHDASVAIDWLHDVYKSSGQRKSKLMRVYFNDESDSLGKCTTSVDSGQIIQAVLDRQRFEMPAVLVIDYAMPQMNGVEFCRAIQNLPCKKILLTGYADEKIAIDAFNQNLIDCFFKKNDHDVLDNMEAEIIRLQNDFFVAHSATLTDLLSRHCYEFLSDPAVGELVKQLSNQYGFVEYYLFANPSSILFFDAGGKTQLMVIETRTGLISHLDIAQDQGAPPELLTALQESRLLPFFSDTDGVYRDTLGQNWMTYCVPPKICHGKQDYYWSLFELPSHYFPYTIHTYAEFLRDRNNQTT